MPDLASRLDAVINRALDEQRIVGTNILVAVDGQIAYARAAGFRDREAGAKLTPRTIFRLASVTKPYVAIAALTLAEAGKLDLDAPVTRYLPDFRPKLADGSQPTILVRHLMAHTSGLGYDLRGASRPVSAGLDGQHLGLADAIAGIATVPLSFAPGTSWQYSVGIDVLGGVLEAAAGKGLAEIVRARVTAPLGLADTAFGVVDPARLAVAYVDGHPPKPMAATETVVGADGSVMTFAPGRIFDPACFASGGAGMAGTAEDFLAFLEVLRKGGAALLTPAFMRHATDNAAAGLNVRQPGRGFSLVWSLFVDPTAEGSPLSPGSWGWGGVYGHQWRVDPVRRMTVVSFTNTAPEGCSGAYPEEIVAAACAAVG